VKSTVGVEQASVPGASPRESDRRFDRCTPGTSKKDLGQPAARSLAQFFCQLACVFRYMRSEPSPGHVAPVLRETQQSRRDGCANVVNAISRKEIEDAPAVSRE
jgi:hypothetical protein